jgi:hypothetical protein
LCNDRCIPIAVAARGSRNRPFAENSRSNWAKSIHTDLEYRPYIRGAE